MSSEYDNFKMECDNEIEAQGNDEEFLDVTKEWFARANNSKYSYHFEWLGRPVIQYPQDLMAMQEIIWRVKPDLIIETGIAHGGSLIFSASMLQLLDSCETPLATHDNDETATSRLVLGIDIDIRNHNQRALDNHPMSRGIKMIQGSSIDPDIIEQVHDIASAYKNILVCLDSNHTHKHVLAELEAYAGLVTAGSYCVVFDTVIDDMPPDTFSDRPWGPGNNPKTAAEEFLKTHVGFEIDKSIQNKYLITAAPDGFLRRVAV